MATSIVSRMDGNLNKALPQVSVILCVNRTNPWLKAALLSVLKQDETEFEFLIAANACADELWQELHEISGHDSRVRLFRTAIGQLSFNLNSLADQAFGDYLVRMDADDLCLENRLSTLREELSRDPVDILGSAVMLIDGDDKVVGRMDFPQNNEDIVRALPFRTVFCHPAVAIRRQFLLDMRGYLGGYWSEDTDLWLRAKRVGARMRNLPQALLCYRVHPLQSIGSRTGYSEVAAHWFRELLLDPSWYNTRGFVIAFAKRLFARSLPGARLYRKTMVANTTERQ